ncbi:MAG TPA: hypothetical protein VF772_23600 [Terriglobales bacterium]
MGSRTEASHGPTDSGNFSRMLTDDTTPTVLYAVTSRNNSTADSAEARHAGKGWIGGYRHGQLAASSPDVSTIGQPVAPGDMSDPQNDTGSGNFRRRLFHQSSHVTL